LHGDAQRRRRLRRRRPLYDRRQMPGYDLRRRHSGALRRRVRDEPDLQSDDRRLSGHAQARRNAVQRRRHLYRRHLPDRASGRRWSRYERRGRQCGHGNRWFFGIRKNRCQRRDGGLRGRDCRSFGRRRAEDVCERSGRLRLPSRACSKRPWGPLAASAVRARRARSLTAAIPVNSAAFRPMAVAPKNYRKYALACRDSLFD